MATDETAWTLEKVQELRTLARERLPVSVISLRLKRPIEAVSAKLAQLGITPAPEIGAG
ncbi:hypothetical protein PMNALOAF_2809 [Methylobacterium adhaesivum]|jgi:hypothetical protein|uniref:Uncharacterized protein n=1 Tax=Methylobacterium adhaesivum TaxID=333297 RepID=A0ABT8BLT0_9HYPH|nr:hypothetical protein [Methylobacterium adhaesivum]MDN3592163.1 hypothetical protein [Methylobacterium adhaesivum]GJD31550.1 hypothetical protein PMNALOAF_2809 [Methylobacterium adhaesivum]